MATISNRSRFFVSVTKRPDLYREFPYTDLAQANAYLAELRARDYRSARLGQHTNRIQIRIRHKGYPDQILTVSSPEAAEQLLLRIQSERASGLLIDYSSARRVTMAQLVKRYLTEECPKHKGAVIEGYTLRGMLADSRGERDKARNGLGSAISNGQQAAKDRAGGQPRRALEWFHKPLRMSFRQISRTTSSIASSKFRPPQSTARSTCDLLAAVINLAIRTWRVRVPQSPLDGVRRPKYFNERDRRLRGDEEARLLAAAREEDLERSLAPVVEEALAPARLAAEQLKNSTAQKRFIAVARREIEERLRPAVVVTPVFETLLSFLLATAARLRIPAVRDRSFRSIVTGFVAARNGRSRCRNGRSRSSGTAAGGEVFCRRSLSGFCQPEGRCRPGHSPCAASASCTD